MTRLHINLRKEESLLNFDHNRIITELLPLANYIKNLSILPTENSQGKMGIHLSGYMKSRLRL